jgi:GAF domain-containing protein
MEKAGLRTLGERRQTRQVLLDRAVALLQARFGLSQVGIYLIDQAQAIAVLRASTGQALSDAAASHQIALTSEQFLPEAGGRRGLTAGSDLSSSEALLQRVIRSGEARLATDESELAIPLLVGGQVIGALDIHSRQPGAEQLSSLQTILSIIADQIALVIYFTDLLIQAQARLQTLETLAAQETLQQWAQTSQARPVIGFQYDHTSATVIPLAQPAEKTDNQSSYSPDLAIEIPIRVRDIEIGALDVWAEGGKLQAQEIALIEMIAERAGVALESARLYEETRSRAVREQILNQLATNIARSLDIDSLLRNATLELGRLPRVREAVVHLNIGEQHQRTAPQRQPGSPDGLPTSSVGVDTSAAEGV